MGVHLTREHGYNMHGWELRERLGLPKRLGPELRGRYELQGVSIFVLSYEEALIRTGKKPGSRPHRIYAACTCGDLIPAGRLHQHKC